jgi:serine protease AprX
VQINGARQSLGYLPAQGKGIGIAVLDSGLAPHPDIDDRVVANHSTVPNSPGTCDFLGHGTTIASYALGNGRSSQGSIQGVAPRAHLINVRVAADARLPLSQEQRFQAVVDGIRWATEQRRRYDIRVLNLSVGFEANAQQQKQLDAALQSAEEAGLVVVAAAGNQGKAAMTSFPANHPNVIAVGALDGDQVANYTSQLPGPIKQGPDVFAPGTMLWGANTVRYPAGPTVGWLDNGQPAYVALQGTSVASPIVAGLIAVLLELNPALKPAEIRQMLAEHPKLTPQAAASLCLAAQNRLAKRAD